MEPSEFAWRQPCASAEKPDKILGVGIVQLQSDVADLFICLQEQPLGLLQLVVLGDIAEGFAAHQLQGLPYIGGIDLQDLGAFIKGQIPFVQLHQLVDALSDAAGFVVDVGRPLFKDGVEELLLDVDTDPGQLHSFQYPMINAADISAFLRYIRIYLEGLHKDGVHIVQDADTELLR